MIIFKRVFLALSLLLCMTFSITAYADENEKSDSGKAAIQCQTNRISYQPDGELLDKIYFICDTNGNFTYYENENEINSRANNGTSAFAGAYSFHNMGYSNGKQAYEVGFQAVASNGLTFTWHEFSAKPTNNKKWLTSTSSHSYKDPIEDAIYYEYPDAGPATPKCSVKIKATLSDGQTHTTTTKTLTKPKTP